jgi:peptide/nickel transport system permease protein
MSVAPAPVAPATDSAARIFESPKFTRRLLSKKVGVACVVYLLIIVGIAIVAPIVMPGVMHESAGDLSQINQGPSWHHVLGTDSLGRDVLDRLLVGARITLIGVLEVVLTSLLIGIPVGLAAGYFGGAVDRIAGSAIDIGQSLPGIIIVLCVIGVFKENPTVAMVALGVLFAPGVARVTRSAVLPVREELYIAAARVSGLRGPYIMFHHVLPRIKGVVIVNTALLCAAALLAQVGLAFLGVLVQPPQPSWGGMIADGIGVIILQPWLIWPPGFATVLTILALFLLGDAIRDTNAEAWSATVTKPKKRKRARASSGSPTVTASPPVLGHGALLSMQGISIAFDTSDGPIRAVDDVSFDVAPGETLGIVGESGCGKTISALAILGLLPGTGHIESGHIIFEDRDLVGLSEREKHRLRGREIALISQEPMVALDPVFRVGTQLRESVRQHHGLSRRDADRRVLELLRLVELPEPEVVAQRYPFELSGGMAQRVAIARGLAGEPKLLIADEPTTALDVTVQAEILHLLRHIQLEREMSMLLVTHDWGVVADICDRAVVMYAGQVVERGAVSTLIEKPQHPYTKALLESNPHHATEEDVLPTISGDVPSPGRWPAGCHFSPRCSYATSECTVAPIPLEDATGAGSEHKTRCIHHNLVVA